ncbi:MAG: tyrosine-type recombinase/integrase [Clostridiaceae bacterium]|nr:tyrosine-type recombinase/integrase [Clostridiaceae bacterium]
MIEGLLNEYQKELLLKSNVRTTIERKLYQVNSFLKWCNSHDIELSGINSADIESYLLQKSRKRGVQVQNREVISHFLEICIKRGILFENPAAEVIIRTTAEERQFNIPSIEEINLVTERIRKIDTLIALRDYAMFEVTFGSGSRIGELVALNIEDTNLTEKTVLLKGKGRGEKKCRFVPLTDVSVKAIQEYIARRNAINGALFISVTGKRMTNSAIYQRFKLWSAWNPHLFRKAFCTCMARNGCSCEMLSRLLGHIQASTLSHYSHLTTADLKTNLHRSHPRSPSFSAKIED